MPREITLLTAQTSFEALHKLADGRRAVVSVDRDTLTHLLTDHSILVTACQGAGIKVIEPAPRRERPKLKP